MRGFEVLSAPVEVVEVAGAESFKIREVCVVDLPEFIEKIRPYYAAGYYAQNGDLLPYFDAITNDVEGLISAISFCAGVDPLRVASLAPDEFLAVFLAVLKVNSQLFAKSKKENDAENSWVDAVQLLITNGHSIEQIRRYTLTQFNCFIGACISRRKGELREMAFIARVAQYDKDAFLQALKGLDDG